MSTQTMASSRLSSSGNSSTSCRSTPSPSMTRTSIPLTTRVAASNTYHDAARPAALWHARAAQCESDVRHVQFAGGRVHLAAGHRAYDEERLLALDHPVRQRRVRRLVRQILLAGVEPHERTPPAGAAVAHRAAQHRKPILQRVQHTALGDGLGEVQPDLAAHPCQVLQMRRQDDADHGSTWVSTDSTAGRSRTIGAHDSPPSAEPYT